MENDLTILCVTRGDPKAMPFLWEMSGLATKLASTPEWPRPLRFVIGLDHADHSVRRRVEHEFCDGHQLCEPKFLHFSGNGFIEYILDQAIVHCDTKYILRLDDDERCSPAMVKWLMERKYREADHWSFPRANLWWLESEVDILSPGDEDILPTLCYIATPPLWPDIQTRLSIWQKSGGRTNIHQASPFGAGRIAPVAIEHHKFLLYSEKDRRASLARYEELQPGAGSGHFECFSVPEVLGKLDLRPLGDGTVK
jgi:hypothetical protein